MAWMTVKVSESNFHEDLLPGKELVINTDHIRMILHDKESSLLFFQNDDCLRVKPRLELFTLKDHLPSAAMTPTRPPEEART